jgi:hypothetical protein
MPVVGESARVSGRQHTGNWPEAAILAQVSCLDAQSIQALSHLHAANPAPTGNQLRRGRTVKWKLSARPAMRRFRKKLPPSEADPIQTVVV